MGIKFLLSLALVASATAAPLEASEGFKLAAKYIQEALNTSVNPCDNFYKFSCEGYIKNRPGKRTLDEIQSEANANVTEAWKNLDQLAEQGTSQTLKMVSKLNKACKDFQGTVDGTELLLDVASEYGGWPVLDKTWTSDRVPNGIFHAIGDIFSVYGVSQGLILPTVNRDKVLSLEGLPDLKTRTKKDLEDEIYALVTRLTKGTVDDAVVKPQVSRIADIEIELAKIKTAHKQEVDTATHSLESVQKEYPAIDWSSYFKGLLESVFGDEWNKVIEKFIINQPALFKDLNQFLASLPTTEATTKDLVNYAIFKLLQQTKPLNFQSTLASTTEEIDQSFHASLHQYNFFIPQFLPDENCARDIQKVIPALKDRLYVDYAFPRSHRADVSEMFDNVLAAFRKSLATLKWLDEESISRSQKKVDGVTRKLAHPDYLTDEKRFDGLYACLNQHVLNTKSSSPLSTYKYLRYNLCAKGQALRSLDPIEVDNFRQPVTVVNAYYYTQENLIVLPAGILHTPIYRLDYPKAINYGAAGMVIGHELGHGYDQNGVFYDDKGQRNTILTPGPKAEFDKMVQCVKTIYGRLGGFDVFDINQDICDSSGIKASYRAYRAYIEKNGEEPRLPGLEQYTMDQIFFIAQGNTWCNMAPGRVNGQMQNFDKFSETFGCKTGDFMRPVDACEVW